MNETTNNKLLEVLIKQIEQLESQSQLKDNTTEKLEKELDVTQKALQVAIDYIRKIDHTYEFHEYFEGLMVKCINSNVYDVLIMKTFGKKHCVTCGKKTEVLIESECSDCKYEEKENGQS